MPRIVRRSAHRRGRRWSIDLNPRVRERPAAPRPPRAGRPATAVSPRPLPGTPGPFRRASRRISVASCDRGRHGSPRARVLHCRQHRKNPPRRAGRAEGVLGRKRDRRSPSSGIPDPGAQGSSARTGSLRTRSWRPDEPTPPDRPPPANYSVPVNNELFKAGILPIARGRHLTPAARGWSRPRCRGNAIMKLYHHPLSGHAHRARLFLSLLGVPHEAVEVDLKAGAHKRPEFLALNPFGQVPVLDDEGTVVPDANAILVYVARKLGRTDWLPQDAAGEAAVQRWLSVAAGELAYGPAAARLITVFGAKLPARGGDRPGAHPAQPPRGPSRRAGLAGRRTPHHRGRRALQLPGARARGQCRPVGLPQRRRLPPTDRGPAGLPSLRPDAGRPHGRRLTPLVRTRREACPIEPDGRAA